MSALCGGDGKILQLHQRIWPEDSRSCSGNHQPLRHTTTDPGDTRQGGFGAGRDLEIRTIGVCLPQSGIYIYTESKRTKADR